MRKRALGEGGMLWVLAAAALLDTGQYMPVHTKRQAEPGTHPRSNHGSDAVVQDVEPA